MFHQFRSVATRFAEPTADNGIRASRMVEDMPTLFRILYCCGLRPGEVLHLEVGDVDLKKGVLLVRASKNDNDR